MNHFACLAVHILPKEVTYLPRGKDADWSPR
jgi:hypothetical protein